MFPRITNVAHVREYVLRLTFADGLTAEMDFRRRVLGRGGVFAPLEDVEFFSQAQVDREVGALVWPNGVDFDPDALYSEASGQPLPMGQTV